MGCVQIITDIDSKNIALIDLIMHSIQTKSFSFRQVSNGVIIQHNPIRVLMSFERDFKELVNVNRRALDMCRESMRGMI